MYTDTVQKVSADPKNEEAIGAVGILLIVKELLWVVLWVRK